MSKIERLKKRREFLLVANQGRSAVTGTMIVQWLGKDIKPSVNSDSNFRIGYTTSRRVGNAVKRNRARRRLRALTHLTFQKCPPSPGDMVIIARTRSSTAPFDHLQSDFTHALQKLGV